MGLLEILTIIFVVLKLVGVVSWSWWIVFTPLIISGVIYLLTVIAQIIMFNKIRRDVNKSFDDDFFK